MCITAMINHVFISFTAVHIHLQKTNCQSRRPFQTFFHWRLPQFVSFLKLRPSLKRRSEQKFALLSVLMKGLPLSIGISWLYSDLYYTIMLLDCFRFSENSVISGSLIAEFCFIHVTLTLAGMKNLDRCLEGFGFLYIGSFIRVSTV